MSAQKIAGTQFRAMAESTAADWRYIIGELKGYADGLASRVIAQLQFLKGDYGGFPVDRLQHCLQCATRAYRDGRDKDYVVMALLHDMGDSLCTYNHPDLAAAILKPFLSEENLWIVQHHDIFQGYYFFHHIGLDRNLRENFRGHPCFEATAVFAEKYDQSAFDPDYDTAPLSFFEPMVRQVMAAPKRAMITKDKINAS